ncbi:latexin-like [Tiliqua scincoides]|uniref:latexin-like n=1 Tax=Tiliqua scincoides TaxID=71010 RepID=UPI003461B77F
MRRLCALAPPAPLLLGLLLLLPAPARPAGGEPASCAAAAAAQALPSRAGRSEPRPQPRRAGTMEIPPSHYPARRALSAVMHCINYQHGGPSKLFQGRDVTQASREDIPRVGHKYRLKFSMEEVLQKDSPVNCTAEILYHHGEPHVTPEVHYTVEGEFGKNTEQLDNKIYNRIKNLPEPIEGQNIPDSYGNVPEEMEPIRHLGIAACGYVMWQNSTEDTWYNVAQIQSVKQVKRNDDYLEFSYVILIHDIVSQEIIPWHIQVLWHPQQGVKVTRNSRQPKQGSAGQE